MCHFGKGFGSKIVFIWKVTAKEQLERMACSFPYSTNALLPPKQASVWSDAQVSQRARVPYYILSIQLDTSIHK